jgi:hypothetical protein
MRRSTLLRVLTLALAYVHLFPAYGHVGAFLRSPSLADGLKGFGAAAAVALYLLPGRLQARGLSALWRRRALLGAVAWGLAAVHAVPAVEHLPRFIGAPSWADAWRGIGASLAMMWFVAPTSQQAALIGAIGRLVPSGRVVAAHSGA